jgi:hypothetical protein
VTPYSERAPDDVAAIAAFLAGAQPRSEEHA